MKRLSIIMVAAVRLLLGCYSCNNDDIFEKEQYKTVSRSSAKVINIFEAVHDLEPESWCTATCGGTLPSE